MQQASRLILAGMLSLCFLSIAFSIPIYDIQYTTDPSGASPLVGQTVTITGLVTAECYAFGGSHYFIQDDFAPWSAIRIDEEFAVTQGDEVTLTGTVHEDNDMTIISGITNFNILSSGNTLYPPIDVQTGDVGSESYEACLIKISDPIVLDAGSGCTDFVVDDGTGSCVVGADAEWYYWPTMGESIASIVGVVNCVSSEFKIEPRLTTDITPPGQYRTIQWIQQVRQSDLINLDDESYVVGDTVTARGIVTMPTGLSYAGTGVKFIYQDCHGGPWSGILCYDPDATTFPALFEGDSVEVTGFITEYTTDQSNMTEIFITEPVQLLGINCDVPEEPVVNTGDLRWPTTAEQWGTVTVKVQDVVVVQNSLPYNEWSVDDGTGKVNIDDDSDSLQSFIRPRVGTQLQMIRGWVYHHYGFYSDSTTYKIEPLYLSDIVVGGSPQFVVDLTYASGSPVPPGGGNITFDIYVLNDSGESQDFDAWLASEYEGGSPATLVMRSFTNFQVGWAINRAGMFIPIPGTWAGGNYMLYARVGQNPDVVWQEDGFAFTKTGATDGSFKPFAVAGTLDPFYQIDTGILEKVTLQEKALFEASPNPFNPETAISYQLATNAHVNLQVYDVQGRLVATLVDGYRSAGSHEVTFDASALASGIYIAKLTTGDYSAVSKMMLVK